MPSLADLISEGEFAKGLDRPSGNPFGRWAQGVAQRTLHPLEALGTVAQESIDDPMATALNWSNPMASSLSGLAGIFAGKGAKTADIVKLYLAQKLKQQGVPDALEYLTPEQRLLQSAKPAKTEFELAHEVAQRNAALPIEHGGLGLPVVNTAMDRAKAMGFDTPAYHGTAGLMSSPDIQSFDLSKGGLSTGAGSAEHGIFSATNPHATDSYSMQNGLYKLNPEEEKKAANLLALLNSAKMKKDGDFFRTLTDENYLKSLEKLRPAYEKAIKRREAAFDNFIRKPWSEGAAYPLLVNTKEAKVKDFMGAQRTPADYSSYLESNIDGDVIFKNTFDPTPTDVLVTRNPSNIRSRFAAFDPMQRNSANLLAGGAAGAVGLATLADLLNQEQYQ